VPKWEIKQEYLPCAHAEGCMHYETMFARCNQPRIFSRTVCERASEPGSGEGLADAVVALSDARPHVGS